MSTYNTDAYIKAIEEYRDAVEHALMIADDPFKAPESVVATAREVQRTSWNMQVEYAAMVNYKKNVIT